MSLCPKLSGRCCLGLMIAICAAAVAQGGWRLRSKPIFPRRSYRAPSVQEQQTPINGPSVAGRPLMAPVQSQFPIQAQFPPRPQSAARRPANSAGPDAGAARIGPADSAVPRPPTRPPSGVARPNVGSSSARTPSPRPTVRHGSSIITFDNQSGEPALVRLVGSTRAEVYVPNGGRNSIHRVAAGHYVIHVRYGAPGHYRYAEGDAFNVTGTATSYSRVTITLHTVTAGNYAIGTSSAAAFANAAP